MNRDSAETDSRQRIFNLPAVILGLIGALVAIVVGQPARPEQSDWLIGT
jgi:hypothetical protein